MRNAVVPAGWWGQLLSLLFRKDFAIVSHGDSINIFKKKKFLDWSDSGQPGLIPEPCLVP